MSMLKIKSHKIAVLAVMLLLICSLGLLSGCTETGNEYLKLNKEVALLEKYTMDATFTMAMDMKGIIGDAELTPELNQLVKDMGNITGTVTAQADASKNLYFMEMKMRFGNGSYLPLKVYMKDSNMLFNTKDYVGFLAYFIGSDSPEIKKMEEAFKGVEWLDISPASGMSAELSQQLASIDIIEFNKFVYGLVDYVNENSFKDYKPAVFAKKGEGYEMSITKEQLAPVSKEFLTYLFDHVNGLVEDVKFYVAKCDESTFDKIGIKKADILKTVNALPTEFTNLTEQDKKEINQIVDMMMPMITDFNVKSYIAKNGNTKYTNDILMELGIGDGSQKIFGIKIDMKATINSVTNVNIAYPTTGVSTIEKMTAGKKPTSVIGVIYLNSGTVYSTKSYDIAVLSNSSVTVVDIKEVKGENYMPAAKMANIIGEQVNYDTKTKNFTFGSGDAKVTVNGFTQNGVGYVKIADLAKLGYTVKYVPELGGMIQFSK